MKLLLATDGLPAAEAAEQLLVRLARRDVEITVATAAGRGDAAGEAAAREIVERTVVRLEEARDTDAGLVVVGARVRKAIDRALVGSVSDQVARYAPAALIARPSARSNG